jgi:hypothetical protein
MLPIGSSHPCLPGAKHVEGQAPNARDERREESSNPIARAGQGKMGIPENLHACKLAKDTGQQWRALSPSTIVGSVVVVQVGWRAGPSCQLT